MQISIRLKCLVLCIGLVLITVVSLSSAYYVLARQDAQRESRQRIQIGFDIVSENLNALRENHRALLIEFLEKNTRLQGALDLYLQQDDRLRAIRPIAFNLSGLITEMHPLKDQLRPDRLSLYDPEKRLVAVYQRQQDEDHFGGYVISATGQDTYLSMDDPAIQTRLMQKKTIPDVPLPQGIAPQFSGDIPERVQMEEFTENRRVGVRAIVPLVYYDRLIGLLQSELLYTDRFLTRQAALSKTEINLFAGSHWSAGTLPVQTALSRSEMAALHSCQAEHRGNSDSEILSITLNGREYYQRRCALLNHDTLVGAISISVSKDFETHAMRDVMLAVSGISAGTILLVSLLAAAVTRPIIRTIRNIVQVIDAMADGDLSQLVEVNSHDEFGVLAKRLNLMAARLRDMLSHVQHSGIQVTSSSTELAATAREQEVTMQHQSASAQDVVHTVQAIVTSADVLGASVKEVAEMSQESADIAGSGQDTLARMKHTMERIEHSSLKISQRLKHIHDKTEKITSVVTTITKVADQTNLLSLNAAIEAEKAGESGRGFTVVATEIRHLADQTAVATLDIEQMVQDMQSTVTDGVAEIGAFMQEVQRSVEDVERISLQFTRIIARVQTLSPRFDDVTVTMGEQIRHAHTIEHLIGGLAEELLETTISLKESFLAIGQLNDAAHGLQEQVNRFKVR